MSAAAITTTPLPPCRLIARSKQGVELFTLPSSSNGQNENSTTNNSQQQHQRQRQRWLLKGAASLQAVSPRGDAAYFHVPGKGVVKCKLPHDEEAEQQQPEAAEAGEPKVFLRENSVGVQMMHLSPATGLFLLTWERWNAATCPYNLRLWNTETGALLAAFAQKNIRRTAWPYLAWTHDEKYAFLHSNNEIRIFPRENIVNRSSELQPHEVRYVDKIRLSGLETMSLPETGTAATTAKAGAGTGNSTGAYYFTSFCVASKDKPARASLHAYKPSNSSNDNNNKKKQQQHDAALLSKSLFQAEECKTHWNAGGDAALITLQTSVDASGESYYGSSQLFLLHSQRSDVLSVPLHKEEGPVLDVGWIPASDKPPCFVVVAGKMPPMASLHHGQTAQPLSYYGHAHRNVVRWSPHGRFLCLAGFGNMQGGMSFWDKNKHKLIPHSLANRDGTLRDGGSPVFCEWSPDSRWFVTATCSPRRNVDNGLRLYKYTGELMTNYDSSVVPWKKDQYLPDQLYQATFVPASKPSIYPDRPQSPVPEGEAATAGDGGKNASNSSDAPTAAASAGAAAAAAAPSPDSKKPAGRYVPPSARNRAGGGGSSLADRMRQEKEGNIVGATKVVGKTGAVRNPHTGRIIPGLTAASNTSGGGGKSKSALKREKQKAKKQQQQQQQQQQGANEAAAAAAAASVGSASAPNPNNKVDPAASASADAPEKRARKLKKTLKQIQELKAKDPSSLNDDQRAKLATEQTLVEELKELEKNNSASSS